MQIDPTPAISQADFQKFIDAIAMKVYQYQLLSITKFWLSQEIF